MNVFLMAVILVTVYVLRLGAVTSSCESCHKEITPEIVQSFHQGRMADGITCIDCHGQMHDSPDNTEKAQMPNVHTCFDCHGEQVAHHQSGRHNLNLADLPSMLLHYHNSTPKENCASCHRDSRSAQQADFGGGTFACLTCHRPHTFLTKKNKRPEICKTCHGLGKNSVWQAWSGSPHGQLYFSKKEAGAKAPFCQTCHMNDGDHRMESRWGAWDLSLFIRDTEWQKSQQTIRRALFADTRAEQAVLVTDSAGAKRMRIRYDQVCQSCHTKEFVTVRRRKSDDILKQADGLMSAAIAIVAHLQNSSKGLLQRINPGKTQPPALERLHRMFYTHRRQVYRAVLHMDYKLAATGLQAMKSELGAIKKFIRRPQ